MLKKLNDAMDYIEAHLEDEFLLEKISEHINVSDYHFRKIFFALTNMTLNEYVKKSPRRGRWNTAGQAAHAATTPAMSVNGRQTPSFISSKTGSTPAVW